MTYYAHASSGCLHIRPLINIKQAGDRANMASIAQFVADLLGDYGGALSSEHGDGRVRSWLNRSFYGPDLYALFEQVKGTFDPHNRFNPGNIVDAPPIDQHLRWVPDPAIPVKTYLHFANGLAEEARGHNRSPMHAVMNFVHRQPLGTCAVLVIDPYLECSTLNRTG